VASPPLRLTQEQVAEQVALIAWERFAVRVGVDARMVSKWERGEKRPSRLYQECLRLLFNDPELFGTGDDAMNRRQWLRGAAAVGTAMLLAEASPGDNGGRSEDGTVGQLLADAMAESVELSRQTEASDLGPATLEHLDLAVERLGLVYMTTPPALLLNELRWYRPAANSCAPKPRTATAKSQPTVFSGRRRVMMRAVVASSSSEIPKSSTTTTGSPNRVVRLATWKAALPTVHPSAIAHRLQASRAALRALA
jgi:transcriptional regulator with XRE-family HTH domain